MRSPDIKIYILLIEAVSPVFEGLEKQLSDFLLENPLNIYVRVYS